MNTDQPTAPHELKADLHLHTCECRHEAAIRYSARQLIDIAATRGFEVLAITNHDTLTWSESLGEYARERGIVLIPGVELTVQGRHVLVYNLSAPLSTIQTFADLQRVKSEENLIIAPHPFFPASRSLGRDFYRWQQLFDAAELCHFYTTRIDFNRPLLRAARATGLPLVGTSDAHTLAQFGTTYSMIAAEKNPAAIFAAIRQGAVQVVTRPLSFAELVRLLPELFGYLPAHRAATIVLEYLAQVRSFLFAQSPE